MNILNYTLSKDVKSNIETEVLFVVASARAQGKEFIEFVLADEKQYSMIAVILRRLKKQGKIQIFVGQNDFESNTKEVMYLKNKFSELVSEFSGGSEKILVKI